MQRRDIVTIIALILYVGLIFTYSNHFKNDFHFDDYHTITGNPSIKSLDNIPKFFQDGSTFSALPSNQSYRPLTSVSLALDYWLAGNNFDPFYFHLSTFIWFLLQGVMLFFLFRIILNRAMQHQWNEYFALFATALFMFHPATAETVNYVIARSDLISTVAVLASLLIYINYQGLRKYQLHILPMIFGVLVKPPTLMYAPILFVYILLFEEKVGLTEVFNNQQNRKKLLNTIRACIPVFITFIILYWFQAKMTPASWQPGGFNRTLYIATQTAVTAQYFFNFFLPLGLSADTDWSLFQSVIDIRVFGGTLFILILLGIAFYTANKEKMRPIAFGIFWFFLALIPTAVTPLAEVLNDHRVFFPFVGLAISVTWAIALFLQSKEEAISSKPLYQYSIIGLAATVVIVFALWTRTRNDVWKTEESLWYDVSIKSPGNGRGLMNYGVIKMGQGDYKTALEYYTRAVELYPRYGTLQTNMGIIKNAMGNAAEAEMHFKKGVEYDPGNPSSHYFYATFLNGKGRYAEAIDRLEQACNMSPCYIVARQMLMDIYNKIGNSNRLKEIAAQTLQCDPADPVAAKYINGSTNTNPVALTNTDSQSPEQLLALSQTLYQSGDYKKCIEVAEKAIKQKPNFPEAYNNICAAYNEMKQWDKAIEAGKKAVELSPNFTLAKNNLAWSIENKNK